MSIERPLLGPFVFWRVMKKRGTMHILILEDEPKVASFLSQALRSEGYQTTALSTLRELDELMEGVHHFDLAIFDRMLGTSDSLGRIHDFKKKFTSCSVLVLSAINTPDERAQALDVGADDYMGKPYSLVELLARIRAIQRRHMPEAAEKSFYVVGGLQLDCISRKVVFQNKRLDFSAKEFQLLALLMKRPGQVFSKYKLLDQIWDTQLDLESNVVETTIRNIRRKLEEAMVDAKIQSKRNVGYWIEA